MPGVQMPHWAPPARGTPVWSGTGAAPRRRFGEALDGAHVAAIDLADGHQAGVHHLAVEEHRAGAALALAAALLGAGQAEVLAQHVEQPAHAGHRDLELDAVDGQVVAHGASRPARRRAGLRERRDARRPGRRVPVEGGQDPLRRGGQLVDPDADRVVDGGHDGGRADVHGQLADALGAVRRAAKGSSTRMVSMRGASSAVGMR